MAERLGSVLDGARPVGVHDEQSGAVRPCASADEYADVAQLPVEPVEDLAFVEGVGPREGDGRVFAPVGACGCVVAAAHARALGQAGMVGGEDDEAVGCEPQGAIE